jgi:hypothetical protein
MHEKRQGTAFIESTSLIHENKRAAAWVIPADASFQT